MQKCKTYRQDRKCFASPNKDTFAYISSKFCKYALLGPKNKILNDFFFLMNATLRNKASYFGGGAILISKKSDIFMNMSKQL